MPKFPFRPPNLKIVAITLASLTVPTMPNAAASQSEPRATLADCLEAMEGDVLAPESETSEDVEAPETELQEDILEQ